MAHAWQGPADAIKTENASRRRQSAREQPWTLGESLALMLGASAVLWLMIIGGIVMLVS